MVSVLEKEIIRWLCKAYGKAADRHYVVLWGAVTGHSKEELLK